MQSTQDVVRSQMQEVEAVLKQLDQELEAVDFDPAMPCSVEVATRQVLETIDSLLARFTGNPILGPLIGQLKTQYLDGIRHQVRAVAESPFQSAPVPAQC